ncbi:monofunctional biosynthetic peptidoglycan transglycosylase [uncultured Paenalcaligenes sp.]|uniref:monofunctional biosynthetic peptidoglycan transglycosylase n=1 Tax=uncultured Paenalcaligenes sp. TaxID=1588925 RepID=UPI00260CC249|nr:monofunctional biosynthetic peptidoglycan transglycosylase [uncultured Paenalcaligenes sp.]
MMTTRSPSRIKRITIILLVSLVLFICYQFSFLVRIVWFNYYNPQSSAIMRQTLAELRHQDPDAQIQFEWVKYEHISDHLKRAVISSEDANFLEHQGVEWEAIRNAWEYNKQQASQGSERRRGGSTLTQQLAKNLFLSNSRSYTRKGQELILSYMIEYSMSKQRILELYLNIAQWGQSEFGAQAAAKRYFHSTAQNLTATQAARLAAMLPNPIFYDKNGNTPFLQRRTNTIVQRMRQVSAP